MALLLYAIVQCKRHVVITKPGEMAQRLSVPAALSLRYPGLLQDGSQLPATLHSGIWHPLLASAGTHKCVAFTHRYTHMNKKNSIDWQYINVINSLMCFCMQQQLIFTTVYIPDQDYAADDSTHIHLCCFSSLFCPYEHHHQDSQLSPWT